MLSVCVIVRFFLFFLQRTESHWPSLTISWPPLKSMCCHFLSAPERDPRIQVLKTSIFFWHDVVA